MQGESELVSVIIPTYNRPERAIRAVDSVRAQTYRALEVVVVDDRSDASCQRALRDALWSRDKVRLYVNDGPKGCAGARNVGLEAAKGAYAAFLDDDDEYLPTKIAAQVNELASRPGVDVIVAGSRTEWRVAAEGQRHGWLDIEFRPSRLFQSCYVMCRREALDGVRFRCNHMDGATWRSSSMIRKPVCASAKSSSSESHRRPNRCPGTSRRC